ncbi:hypothetical protein HAP94_01140 [Acidithiobacillus ferrivorans]|nr:hypothetical protein [Acidithiobacillus ferrivorans]
MLVTYIVMTFAIILLIFQATKIYFIAKNPWCMMLLGLGAIIWSVLLITSINNLEKTNLLIFKDLKIAGYIINISLAAIGANIIAGAIAFRAEHTVKKQKKEDIKNLEMHDNYIAEVDKILERNLSSIDKNKIIERKIKLQEKAGRLRNVRDDG